MYRAPWEAAWKFDRAFARKVLAFGEAHVANSAGYHVKIVRMNQRTAEAYSARNSIGAARARVMGVATSYAAVVRHAEAIAARSVVVGRRNRPKKTSKPRRASIRRVARGHDLGLCCCVVCVRVRDLGVLR
jgi:hypothetical protein